MLERLVWSDPFEIATVNSGSGLPFVGHRLNQHVIFDPNDRSVGQYLPFFAVVGPLRTLEGRNWLPLSTPFACYCRPKAGTDPFGQGQREVAGI
jgi:hypothetical protein